MDKYDEDYCVRIMEEDPVLRKIYFDAKSMTLWEKLYYNVVIGRWFALLRFLGLYPKE